MEVFLGALAVSAVASVSLWYLRPEQKMRRMLRRMTRVEIGKARDNKPVIVTGKLGFAGEPLVAPLTGRRCAAYTVVVEEQRGTTWTRIIEETRATDFFVRDETGKAHVLMNQSMDERAVVTLDRGFDHRSTPSRLTEFLARRGESTTGLFFERPLQAHEGVLEEGVLVVAAAVGRWEPDPEPDPVGTLYRESPRKLVLQSTPGLAVQASDSVEILRDVARGAAAAK
jgi:hypothetical protein